VAQSGVWHFDDLLDLVRETSNFGLEWTMGYTLGYVDGLLSGRQRYLLDSGKRHSYASESSRMKLVSDPAGKPGSV